MPSASMDDDDDGLVGAWSDENRQANDAPATVDEQRVHGAHGSFEQLLARELAKAHAIDGAPASSSSSSPLSPLPSRVPGPTANKRPKRPFLRKGARGWWMDKPEARARMQKHVLTSVVDPETTGLSLSSPRRRSRSAMTSKASAASATPPRRTTAAAGRPGSNRTTPPRSTTTTATRASASSPPPPPPPPPPPMAPAPAPVRGVETPERVRKAASGRPTRTSELRQASVQYSPVRISPKRHPIGDRELLGAAGGADGGGGVRRSLPLWMTTTGARTSASSINSPAAAAASTATTAAARDSVDVLSMSGVQRDLEAKLEREADELADFEALERELAAEKETFYLERELASTHDEDDAAEDDGFFGFGAGRSNNAFDAHDWSDSANRAWDPPHDQDNPEREDSFQDGEVAENGDLGGQSSLVFAGDRIFRSPPRPAAHRRSLGPSEFSAFSFDDSEPWADTPSASASAEHFSRLPESPIPKHGMTSVLLNPSPRDEDRSRETLWTGKGSDRADEDVDHFDLSDEVLAAERDQYRQMDGTPPLDAGGAPVSALMRELFGDHTGSNSSHAREIPSPQGSMSVGRDTHVEQQVTDQKTRSAKQKASAKPPTSAKAAKAAPTRNTPSGKPKNAAPQRSTLARAGIESTLPAAIEEKLLELEEEVKFYKAETLQLQRKKAQLDDELRKLSAEKVAFDDFRKSQQSAIEQEWARERQRMKKEEKMFERQMKLKLSAASSAQNRKERAEVDALKAQIVKLQLDAKHTASKSKSTMDALRQRIAELEGRNRELSDEIKFLERDRLEQWEKNERLAEELRKEQTKRPGADLRTIDDVVELARSADELLSSLKGGGEQTGEAPSFTGLKPTASSHSNQRDGGYNPTRYATDAADKTASEAPISEQRESHQGIGGSVSSTVEERDSHATRIVDEITHPGGKREVSFEDGTKRICFADGNEKDIFPDGHVVIRFTNGDRKEYYPDTGISVYHYHEAQTKLTTYPDKTKVYEFPNQQVEKSFPDGRTEILFADGIKKTIEPSGDEFSTFPDGTTMLERKDGLREVTLLNQKRVRYYPDGQMALVNSDGSESQVRSDAELRVLMHDM